MRDVKVILKIHPQKKYINIFNQVSQCLQYHPLNPLNKYDVYVSKDSMKKFGESLYEHVIEIINSKNQNLTLLTNEQQKSYENVKINLQQIC